MSGDALFPFPEPTFLFTHDLVLRRRVSETIGGRGRVTFTYAPEPLRGYLTAPDPESVPDAGGVRERVSAVALVPLTTVVDPTCRIACTDAAVPTILHGDYDIVAIRPNLSHIRLLLSKYVAPWGADSESD